MAMQILRNHIMRDPTGDARETAVTVRPSSTAVFAVDSDDRYTDYPSRRLRPTYPFSINITKNQSMLNGFFNRIAVAEFRMYWTLPNIAAVWGNNTLSYYESVTPAIHTITIPVGFYDLRDLMLTIESEVQGDGFLPNFIATANPDGSTSYGTGDANLFYWVPPNSTTRTLYDMLNLVNTIPIPTAATTQQGGIANLKSTDYIDVISPQLTYNQELKDGSTAQITRDMLVRIYLDNDVRPVRRTETLLFTAGGAPDGSQVPQFDPTDIITGSTPFVVYRQFSQPKQILWNNTQPLGNVTFELYDDQGRNIQDLWNNILLPASPVGQYFANSFVWNMTLLVSES